MESVEQEKFKRFKLLRKTLGMTQNQLAELLEVKTPFITMIENANRWIDRRTLFLLERKSGVSASWLLSGEGLFFSDYRKGVTILKKKSRIENRHEAYFICSIAQQAYTPVDNEHGKEHLLKMLDFIEYLFSTLDEEQKQKKYEHIRSLWGFPISGKSFGEVRLNIEKYTAYQKTVPSVLMNTTARTLAELFSSGLGPDYRKDVYDKFNELLIPYLFHVCQAYITQQSGLEPLNSIFFDVELNRVNDYLSLFDEKQEKQHLYIKNRNVILRGCYSVATFSFEKKAYIELSCERLFCLLALCININVQDTTLKGLDFEVFKNDVDKTFQIKHRNINLIFTIEEYKALLEVVDELKKIEGGRLWQWMQAKFVDKYGFV